MVQNRIRLAAGTPLVEARRALEARAPLPPKVYLVPDSPIEQAALVGDLAGWLRAEKGVRVGLVVAHPPRISHDRLEDFVGRGISTLDWRLCSAVPRDYDRGMGAEGALDAAIAWLDEAQERCWARIGDDGGRQLSAMRIEAWVPLEARAVHHPSAIGDLVARLDGRVQAIRLALWPRRDAAGRESWPPFGEVAARLEGVVALHEARDPSSGRAELDIDGASGLPPCLLSTDAGRAYIHFDSEDPAEGPRGSPPTACRPCVLLERCPSVRSGRIVAGGPGGWAELVMPVSASDPASTLAASPGAGYGSMDRRLLHVPQSHHATCRDWLARQWDSDTGRSSGASRIDLAASDRSGSSRDAEALQVLLCRLPVPGRLRDEGITWLPPLSMILLASSLRRAGHPVQVCDLAAEACASGLDRDPEGGDGTALVDFCRERLRAAFDRAPGIGLAGFSIEDARAVPLAAHLASDVGTAAWRVAGGRGVSQGSQLLRDHPSFDVVIEGEGEVPLEWVASRLAARRGPNGIPGTSFRQGGTILSSASAEHALDLAATPDVSWVDFALYGEAQFPFEGRRVLPYMFVHGCPFHCAFCADYTGGRMRMRDPAIVVRHLQAMVDQTGVRDYLFLNTLVNASPAYLAHLLDGLLAARMDLRWSDSAKPRWLDRAALVRMREAGCVALTWGIDAGSLRLNKAMHKGFDMEEGSRILQWTHEAGIESVVNLIAGLPHETDADVGETLEWLRRHRPYVNYLNVMPYRFNPNSLIHLFPDRFGIRPSEDGAGYHEIGGRQWASIRVRTPEILAVIRGEAARLGYRPGVRSSSH